MKTILHEIKNFRRLMKLNEDIESSVKVALIGDSLTNYLKSNDYISLPNLVNDDMTVDELIEKLSKEEPKVDVDHVFVSIGANDKFKNKKNIPFLVEYLNQIFPNANINIIKGIVGDEYFYGGEDETDFKTLEDESKSFYNTFTQNGLEVLGSYDSIDYDLGFSDDKIKTLKKEIANSLFQNISNVEVNMDPKKEDKPFVQKDNVDISGDDVTDFDTIYEFLERFEEMWNSGNIYDSRSGGSFKPDIEQIQLALNFLDPLYDIEITGKFDRDTEDAIYKYQKSVNLPETGVADSDTLEDMFFNLKIKGFDDEDLSIYLKNIDGYIDKTKKEINKFTGNVDSVWKSFTDKIIDNFEGGYWNRDKTKSNSDICLNHPWDDIYDNSGETMFGIDRRAGGWDNDPEGRQFFELIDDEKENSGSMESFCNTWTYNYGGGGLRDELKLRAAALMKNAYDDNSRFFSPATKREVESNKRLLFHFAYACWNGSGFFQRFANDINDAIEEGKTGNELVDVAIQSRNGAFGGTGWAGANQEVVDIIKNDPDLEN
jgi:peptidoglycan hydrolase-like protein with peptidoglycan-binding domain